MATKKQKYKVRDGFYVLLKNGKSESHFGPGEVFDATEEEAAKVSHQIEPFAEKK